MINALDFFILIMAFSSLFRGYEIGLVRQVFSTVGFIVGLLIGALLQQYTVQLVDTPLSRSLVTIGTTLGCALIVLSLGERYGAKLKIRIQQTLHIDKFDGWLGSLLGAATLLGAIWLAANVLLSLPSATTQSQIRGSQVVTFLNRNLPAAPEVIAGLGRLIDPNGFPQVFTGREPELPANTTVPGISSGLQKALDAAKVSVVKIEGFGCGGVVDGSGFVIGNDLVATNAHVVAGVKKPYIKDATGQHSATAVWFDPNLDFAVLRVQNLAGPPLLINNSIAARGTEAAVIGYPGGGPLTAGGAQVIEDFTARGRDIYGEGVSERDVYSLAANIIPGNSGGPVIQTDGTVIGVVFAQSTVYKTIGYALSTPQLNAAISLANSQNRTVNTGNCAQ